MALPRIVPTVALALLLACPAVAAPVDENARNLYRRGMADYKAGKPAEAIAKFRAASESAPSYPQPLLAAGIIHLERFEKEMHGYEEACETFDKLVALLLVNSPEARDKDLYQGFFYKGLLHLKGGDYKTALMELDKFTEVYPDFHSMAEVHNARGIAFYYLDQYDQAVAAFKKALEIDAGYAEARFNLRSVFTRITAYNEAMVLYRAGELDRAKKRLEVLSDIAPRYLAGRRLEARILTDEKKYEEAINVYDEILSFQPNDPETYWMRIEMARTLIGLGRKDEARTTLLDNLARFPNVEDQRARMEVVMLLSQLGSN